MEDSVLLGACPDRGWWWHIRRLTQKIIDELGRIVDELVTTVIFRRRRLGRFSLLAPHRTR